MKLHGLQDHIAAETDLVVGETLFAHNIPATVSSGVLLVAELPNAEVDHEIPGVHRARFQIIVRDPDHDAGSDRAWELYHLLWREQPLVTADQTFTYIRPMHMPFAFRRSPADIVEWSINFTARLLVAA